MSVIEIDMELLRSICPHCRRIKCQGLSLCVGCLDQLPAHLREQLAQVGEFRGRRERLNEAMRILRGDEKPGEMFSESGAELNQ